MTEDITITLLGKRLRFTADEGVADARRVAELLTQEVHKVTAREKQPSSMDNFAKLTQAALNIANDFVELQRRYTELEKKFTDRSNALLKSINARL
ncbi:MAG: cell division protein ZapA [Thermodesulfobacteriota bacterium]